MLVWLLRLCLGVCQVDNWEVVYFGQREEHIKAERRAPCKKSSLRSPTLWCKLNWKAGIKLTNSEESRVSWEPLELQLGLPFLWKHQRSRPHSHVLPWRSSGRAQSFSPPAAVLFLPIKPNYLKGSTPAQTLVLTFHSFLTYCRRQNVNKVIEIGQVGK